MRLLQACFFTFLVLSCPVCASAQKGDTAGKLTVIATLFPQFDFVRAIGQDRVNVVLLLPPGVEAHAFDPKPRDIIRMSRADILIFTGRYMEPWVEDLLQGCDRTQLLVIDASAGIELLHDPTRAGVDPHIWLDFSNAEHMVDTILTGLIAKDPSNADFFSRNAADYKQQLRQLDTKFNTALTACKSRTFITTGHLAFGYFAKRYGLRQVSPYRGFFPDAEPSPAMMAQIIQTIKDNGITVIFYEELLSPKLALTLARDTGVKILPLAGAHNISKAEFDAGVTFLSLMEENLRNLREGLGCP